MGESAVMILSGSCDWVMPVKYTEDYYNAITAPRKEMPVDRRLGTYCSTGKSQRVCGYVEEDVGRHGRTINLFIKVEGKK